MYAFGTVMGAFTIYGSIMGSMLDSYGYSSDQTSYMGAAMTIIGIVSAGIFGAYVQKNRRFRRVFIFLATLGGLYSISYPMFLKVVGYDFGLAMIFSAVMGITFIPFMPLSFDYGCQILFPTGQALITGCLMTFGNLVGALMVYMFVDRQ